jgi:hypothetical protein
MWSPRKASFLLTLLACLPACSGIVASRSGSDAGPSTPGADGPGNPGADAAGADAAGPLDPGVDAGSDARNTDTPSGETPFGGQPWPVPGTIQAEDFDNGGEGVAYHDADPANHGGALMTEMTRIHDAVRGTGSDTVVMLCPMGCYNTEGLNASDFAGFTNVVWDAHYYNWLSGYSADLATNQQRLAAEIAQFKALKDVPVIVGEFGDSTSGQSVDVGWQAVIQAVVTVPTGAGFAAWEWNWSGSAGGDNLLAPPYDGSALTAYGQMIKDAITTGD